MNQLHFCPDCHREFPHEPGDGCVATWQHILPCKDTPYGTCPPQESGDACEQPTKKETVDIALFFIQLLATARTNLAAQATMLGQSLHPDPRPCGLNDGSWQLGSLPATATPARRHTMNHTECWQAETCHTGGFLCGHAHRTRTDAARCLPRLPRAPRGSLTQPCSLARVVPMNDAARQADAQHRNEESSP